MTDGQQSLDLEPRRRCPHKGCRCVINRVATHGPNRFHTCTKGHVSIERQPRGPQR